MADADCVAGGVALPDLCAAVGICAAGAFDTTGAGLQAASSLLITMLPVPITKILKKSRRDSLGMLALLD
jgi:hypothetical protein